MQFSNIRVVIVDDFAPWRRFAALVLAVIPGIKVVGEAEDGLTAIEKITELQPDIVTLDIGLPGIDGIEVSRRIKALSPQTKVVFLTEHCSQDIVQGALSTGAFGYVIKAQAVNDLIPAVLTVLADDHFVSLKATESLPSDSWNFGKRLYDRLNWM